MRADGSLRLLLNVRLFNGMSCEVIQDRSIRVIAWDSDHNSIRFVVRVRAKRVANQRLTRAAC